MASVSSMLLDALVHDAIAPTCFSSVPLSEILTKTPELLLCWNGPDDTVVLHFSKSSATTGKYLQLVVFQDWQTQGEAHKTRLTQLFRPHRNNIHLHFLVFPFLDLTLAEGSRQWSPPKRWRSP